MADPIYGYDYSVLGGVAGDDLDGTFSEISEEEVLLQDVWKQVSTPAGSCFWAPTKTLDLRDYLWDSISLSDAAALEKLIEGLFEDDPRMGVAATVAFAVRVLTVDITITPVKGASFRAVLTVDSNDVRIERG